jgi:hypothetical protein
LSGDVDPVIFNNVYKVLKNAIIDPAESKGRDFVNWAVSTWLTRKNLQKAVDEDLDILKLALNHYGLGHHVLTPLFRMVLRNYWNEIEELLINPENVYEIIAEKPECKEIIDTKEGIEYLNRMCINSYDSLYNFVWGKQQKPFI